MKGARVLLRVDGVANCYFCCGRHSWCYCHQPPAQLFLLSRRNIIASYCRCWSKEDATLNSSQLRSGVYHFLFCVPARHSPWCIESHCGRPVDLCPSCSQQRNGVEGGGWTRKGEGGVCEFWRRIFLLFLEFLHGFAVCQKSRLLVGSRNNSEPILAVLAPLTLAIFLLGCKWRTVFLLFKPQFRALFRHRSCVFQLCLSVWPRYPLSLCASVTYSVLLRFKGTVTLLFFCSHFILVLSSC